MSFRNFKVGCIIYSRMKSSRFPAKAKYKLSGVSLLERVISKTKLIKNKSLIILGTSNDPSDDEMYDIAKKNEILCYRGSLLNVFERTKEILNTYNLDYFARICGDRPLLDPYIHDLAIEQIINDQLDLCTTLSPKIMPPGLTVEIVSAKSFLNINQREISEFNKEHITSKYYESPKLFNIKSLNIPKQIEWKEFYKNSYTLDKKSDLEFLNFNIRNLSNVKFGIKYHQKLQKLASDWNKIIKNKKNNI